MYTRWARTGMTTERTAFASYLVRPLVALSGGAGIPYNRYASGDSIVCSLYASRAFIQCGATVHLAGRGRPPPRDEFRPAEAETAYVREAPLQHPRTFVAMSQLAPQREPNVDGKLVVWLQTLGRLNPMCVQCR